MIERLLPHVREFVNARQALANADALGAWLPADNRRLRELVASAIPPLGDQAAAGTATVRRISGLPWFLLHFIPVGCRQLDFGIRPVAALVLVIDASIRPPLDAEWVAAVLGLSAAESQVAIMLAEGRTPHEIAVATGRRHTTVKVLLRRAYRKLGISRQVDLVRLVLSLPDVSPRR